MKAILCVMIFSLSTVASAESIQKWTDEAGKVHYGNKRDASNNDSAETLTIQDTFDQKEYDAGQVRHKENEKIGKQYDKERAKAKKEELKAAKKKGEIRPPTGGAPRPYPKPAK